MSQAVVGGLIGKSTSWVKAVESGQIQQPKLPTLFALVEVLRLSGLAQLTGGQSTPAIAFRGPGHAALPAVREAINLAETARRVAGLVNGEDGA
jgi:hypothetical protein